MHKSFLVLNVDVTMQNRQFETLMSGVTKYIVDGIGCRSSRGCYRRGGNDCVWGVDLIVTFLVLHLAFFSGGVFVEGRASFITTSGGA